MFGAENSVTDIVILLGIVLLILLLFASMEQRRRKQAGSARSRKRSTGSDGANHGLKLTPDEEQTLARLGWLLKNPADRNKLLTDRKLFLRAAQRALKEGIAGESELLRLAQRAGFHLKQISSDAMSTRKLPSGAEVSVADRQMRSGAGVIAAVHPDTLRVKLHGGHTAFGMGTQLDVVCSTNQGLYRFTTSVRGNAGKTLHLEHTDRIEQVQRREHRRHNLEIPVGLRGRDGTVHRSRTADLSIGGAAVRNPRKAFARGSRVVVQTGGAGPEIKLPGRVVRTSRGGRILHIQFDELPEASRHRLFRTIMSETAGKR